MAESVSNLTKSDYINFFQHFFDIDSSLLRVRDTQGGVNNVVKIIDVLKLPDSKELEQKLTNISKENDNDVFSSYILRIYINNNNKEKVLHEHNILSLLSHCNSSTSSYTWKVPEVILSKKGERIVNFSEKSISFSLFEKIEGILPYKRMIRSIGRATGQLSQELMNSTKEYLEKFSLPPTPPYYDLYNVVEEMNKEKFLSYWKDFLHKYNQEIDSSISSSTPDYNTLIPFFLNELEELESFIEEKLLKESEDDLPRQLIHGDLHYDNILIKPKNSDDINKIIDVESNEEINEEIKKIEIEQEENLWQVSALLDFEFLSYDYRIMELAISLSKYTGEKEALIYYKLFINEYKNIIKLNNTEKKYLKYMIKLRIISNIIFFVGKILLNENNEDVLLSRLENYKQRILWIDQNENEILKMF